mmetsp:Transcript_21086/g.28421  ORF Transcript_21086/g.28421 Transcript_21086/m.28421 type:complete len:96 (+) Transcript_21086:38-325(+)
MHNHRVSRQNDLTPESKSPVSEAMPGKARLGTSRMGTSTAILVGGRSPPAGRQGQHCRRHTRFPKDRRRPRPVRLFVGLQPSDGRRLRIELADLL